MRKDCEKCHGQGVLYSPGLAMEGLHPWFACPDCYGMNAMRASIAGQVPAKIKEMKDGG